MCITFFQKNRLLATVLREERLVRQAQVQRQQREDRVHQEVRRPHEQPFSVEWRTLAVSISTGLTLIQYRDYLAHARGIPEGREMEKGGSDAQLTINKENLR